MGDGLAVAVGDTLTLGLADAVAVAVGDTLTDGLTDRTAVAVGDGLAVAVAVGDGDDVGRTFLGDGLVTLGAVAASGASGSPVATGKPPGRSSRTRVAFTDFVVRFFQPLTAGTRSRQRSC